MDTNLPAPINHDGQGVTTAPRPNELDAAAVDDLRRRTYSTLINAVHEPYQAPADKPEEAYLNGKSKYEVMCIRVLQRATDTKCDMRAAEFIQEHMLGKAVQRVESQNVTVTYQDLLAKTAEAERRFKEAQKKQEQSVHIEDVVDAETIPVSWDDLR